MPINQTQANKEIRDLVREIRADGQTAVPFGKPELLAIFNAIIAVWEGSTYRNGISAAIEGEVAGLTNLQKRRLHEAAMRVAIKEGLL